MTIDIAHLRALLAAATPGKWYVVESPWGEGDWLVAGSPDPHGRTFVADTDDPSFEEGDRDEDEIARYRPLENAALIAAAVNDLPALLDDLEALRAHAADVNHYLRAILDGKPASICSFCHHLSENNPEAMRAHVLACEKHPLRAAVTAWREATGCDGPGEAEQLARDAVVVREGHWDAALAERAAWRTATGCDTPAEAGEGRAFDRALSRQQELARLREAEIPVALCWFLRWVLDEDERRALRERWRTVTSWLASLAGMDRVPCRHYRECGCREVLDRERVMRMIVDLRDAPGFRGLAGKL